MAQTPSPLRILIVEDEYYLAADLAEALTLARQVGATLYAAEIEAELGR